MPKQVLEFGSAEEQIRKGAASAGLKKIPRKYVNVSYAFSKTSCLFIKRELEKGNLVAALRVPGLKGVFSKNNPSFGAFSNSLCDDIKKIYGHGFITSDELPDYGVMQGEVDAVREMAGAKENDVVVFVAASMELAKKVLDPIASRLEYIINS